MKLLREPLLHFLLMGAALFVLFDVLGSPTASREDDRIVVDAARIEHLALGFARTWQRPPTPAELDGLIEDFVRDEVLYREALAMGLDRDDTIIRRRMRQKLEFLSDDVSALATPTDEDLRAFLLEHAGRFRVEPEIAFRQVYLDRDRRGESVDAHARELLAQLEAAGADASIETLGDALMLPNEFERTARSEVARTFGDAFAEQLFRQEPLRWLGPLESGYGAHLVFVRERIDGRVPELEVVRDAVEREWLDARRNELRDAYYRTLRERYTVVVEAAAQR